MSKIENRKYKKNTKIIFKNNSYSPFLLLFIYFCTKKEITYFTINEEVNVHFIQKFIF